MKQSHIGQIAMSLALVGADKQEDTLDDFDFYFLDGDPSDGMLLLVIKVRARHSPYTSRLSFLPLSLSSCSCVANVNKQYRVFVA